MPPSNRPGQTIQATTLSLTQTACVLVLMGDVDT